MRNDDVLVLNGLPRHGGQAKCLENHVMVKAVILLEGAPNVIRERLRSDSGGDRHGRTDDNTTSIKSRMALFEARTKPLLGHYKKRGALVLEIPVTADMTAREMYAAIVESMSAQVFETLPANE